MGRRNRGRNIHGIIVLDKPAGESSNRSLQKVKRLLDAAKAGHTGSLDPLATGVLPLCFGEATKLSQFLLEADKKYRATIKLGVKTASGDSQGEVLTSSEVIVTQEKVESCLAAFRGEIIQVPSMYSALKHQGVPLYKLARKGQEVERKERTVNISRLEMMDFRGDEIDLEIDCSKGTYIRSIADDLGDMLGIGGHVTVLRRLASGPFKVEESISIETLQQEFDAGGPSALDRYLQPADLTVQGLEKVDMPASTAEYVRQGQPVIARGLPTEGKVRLYADGEFFGIGKILDDGRVAPVRLLNTR